MQSQYIKMTHEIKKPNTKDDAIKFLGKIVVNTGVGRLSSQPNFEEKGLPQISRDLAALTGQKPHVRRVNKSIAGFKVREGQIVGLRVTLRRRKMIDFFNRLIRIVLPRVKDFRGLELRNVDAGGVLNMGLREQFVFPEISPEQSPLSFSLEISIVPKKVGRDEAIAELRKLGVPLKKK